MEGQVQSSNENKKAIRVLALEFGFVLLLLAGVLAAFSYFGILPLSKTFPFLSFLPVKEKYSINVSSQVPGYKVTLNNEKKLIEFLNTWGIFGKPHDYSAWGSTGSKPLSSINVVLVPFEIKTNAVTDKNQNIFIGSSLAVKPEGFTIEVYLNKSILEDNGRSAESKGNSFLMGFITPIYRGTYPSTVDKPNPDAPKLFDVVADLARENYFKVDPVRSAKR